MKKALSLFLALMMILPLMIVVNAADFTLDGKLDEAIWLPNAWIEAGAGDWENPQTRNESYKMQFRTDDTNLYVAVKTNFAPKGTDTLFGNGNASIFRLWTFVDGRKKDTTEFTTYNYIVEYSYKPAGSVFVLRENTNAIGNSSVVVADSGGITSAEVVGTDSWSFELKIPFTAIGATDSVRAFASFATTTASGSKDGYATMWYPSFVDNQFRWDTTTNKEVNNAFAPYVLYNKDRALVLKFADLKIGGTYVAPRPAGTMAIDNFGDYVGNTTTIMKRLGTTIGEISKATNGAAEDYNYFSLVAVDSTNKVVSVNKTLGRPAGSKDKFVVPDGGYVLLFNEDKATDKDLFKTIAVGDVVTLTGVDLAALKTAKTKADLTGASFTFKKGDAAASTAIAIDNFGGFASAKTTIMARVDVKKTIGEIALQTYGTAKNFNYFHMATVDANNKVAAINYGLGASFPKDTVEIPEGGYVLLCNGTKPDEVRNSFMSIAVGDEVKLYNIDLNALAIGGTKANTLGAGFAFKKAGSDVINASNTANITISDTKLLSDGDKVSAAGNWTATGVQLIQNKAPTNAAINPEVNLIRNLGSIKRIDKVELNFYHCYNVMIGLPKNNTVILYTSVDGFTYKRAGIYKINGEAKVGEFGTVETVIDIPDADAQFIKLSYLTGPSPFPAPETKVVWEFTAMTEFGFVEKTLGNVEDNYVKEGLEALYSGKDNTGDGLNSYATTWKDLSGKGLDITVVNDNTNYFTENGYRFKNIKTMLPAKITDIVNGDEYTVEIVVGAIDPIGANFQTLMNSENDYFALFRRVPGDFIEFKASSNIRPKVAGGLDFVKDSTITITSKLGGKVKMYIDGVLIGEGACTVKNAANAMFFGWPDVDAAGAATNKNFGADYKGMRFYSKELTADQVAANAKADRDINYVAFAPATFVGAETLPAAASAGALPAKIKDVLVSASKPYSMFANGGHRDGYILNLTLLTDGIKHGGSVGGGFGVNNKYAEVVLDLGEVRNDLYKFSADLIGGDWGIAQPNGIKVAVSDDGTNFKYVGEAKTVADNFFTVSAANLVSGRYVKFYLDAGSHVWLSEIEVYAAEAIIDDVSEDVSQDVSEAVSEAVSGAVSTDSSVDSSTAASSEAENPGTGDMTLEFVFIAIIAISAGVIIKRRRA